LPSSQEYFEAKGGSNSKWVAALFKDATGATSVPRITPRSFVHARSRNEPQNYADTIFSSLAAGRVHRAEPVHQFLERNTTGSKTTISIAEATPLAQLLARNFRRLDRHDDRRIDEFFQFTKSQNAG